MTSRIRVALYSHDTLGLGHTRRNLAVAETLVAADDRIDVLMITGNPEVLQLPQPRRTDLITLPTVMKDPDGTYRPRRQRCELAELIDLRTQVITAAVRSFAPQLLVVDKIADGLQGELLPTLRALRADPNTKIVLGLREILDSPTAVRREWRAAGTADVIKDHYDEVWVYGDPAVFDPAREYGWAVGQGNTINYLGYLGRSRPAAPPTRPRSTPTEPYLLCQVGGGQDGYALADAFARAELPAGHRGVILTGPYLSADDRDRLYRVAGSAVDIVDFVPNPEEFVDGASAVVSMAGYNSTVELLSTSIPVLLVPRVTPRVEQLIRAERLADAGHVDLLRPELLQPGRLTAWMAAAVTRPPQDRSAVDLGGLQRIQELALRLIEGVPDAA
ncbi:glycosyltransferase family protein [Microlunatus soli]|uniref:Predicted glycosyl transferase n=1 Tax=Microlunatus soli TaxID=630515 RepID=A0A1H1NXC4_9ACTN|nr:glycosyltransferase [Microlunatus soli]SDS03594.1 Predicted glycosyl transferase [Microlunatus soli]